MAELCHGEIFIGHLSRTSMFCNNLISLFGQEGLKSCRY